ncbi:manganese efflux pump MntP [Parabacteroides sp.]
MSIIEIVLLAIGLSMDSLAVSVTGGAVIRNCTICNMVKIGSFMGITQAAMTVLGYLAGVGFQKYITAFDHWIAFILLLYLGGKMIYDSTRDDEEECKTNPLCNKTLFGLAIATSIDALAIGISLAILKSEIVIEASLIGIITFLMSVSGVYFGSRFGRKVDLKLDLIGGLILIGIGTKILIEHLFLS